MEINEFNELVTDVVDKAISQIEQSSNAFEVDFTSSAGFDYDLPSFDISVNGITDFSFDGIGGSIQFEVSVSVHIDVTKYDGWDKDKVDMGSCDETLETNCSVNYLLDENSSITITCVKFDDTLIEFDGDDVLGKI